jgi:hypothetical protein
MQQGEIDTVKLASKKQGDSFWYKTELSGGNKEDEEGCNADWIFEEILSHLHAEGLDLKLIQLGE